MSGHVTDTRGTAVAERDEALDKVLPFRHHHLLRALMRDVHLLYEVGRDREAASRVHDRIMCRVYHDPNGDGR